MGKKLLFIYNPHSGKGLIRNYLADIVDTMVKAGFEVTIYPTQAPADATRKVQEEADKLWNEGVLGADAIEKLSSAHLRTPYIHG